MNRWALPQPVTVIMHLKICGGFDILSLLLSKELGETVELAIPERNQRVSHQTQGKETAFYWKNEFPT